MSKFCALAFRCLSRLSLFAAIVAVARAEGVHPVNGDLHTRAIARRHYHDARASGTLPRPTALMRCECSAEEMMSCSVARSA